MTTIKIKPLSVNEAWQGRRFKTPEYKSYEKALMLLLPNIEIPPRPWDITLIWGVNPLMDWDNPIKPYQDILQKRYGINDRYIYHADVTKVDVKPGCEFVSFEINTFTNQ